MMTMRALSVRPAWAWLIVRPDLTGKARVDAVANGHIKTVENRTWKTKFRGRFLIHASSTLKMKEYLAIREKYPFLAPISELQRSGIIGAATLVDCIPPASITSNWHIPGQYGFQLTDIEPLPFRPLKGRLQFFKVNV